MQEYKDDSELSIVLSPFDMELMDTVGKLEFIDEASPRRLRMRLGFALLLFMIIEMHLTRYMEKTARQVKDS